MSVQSASRSSIQKITNPWRLAVAIHFDHNVLTTYHAMGSLNVHSADRAI